jgi:alpha-1,3-rhamnosyl/mannosyltransferase
VPLNPRLPNRRFDLAQLRKFPNLTLVETPFTPFMPRYQWALKGYLPRTRREADLTHFPYYIRPYLGYARSVVTLYDVIPIRYPQTLPTHLHAFAFRWLTWLAVKISRLIFTISQDAAHDLRHYFAQKNQAIITTYLAAESRFAPASTAAMQALRARLNLPERFLFALAINKPHKNLTTLLRAFARVQSDAHLVLGGFHDARFPDPRAEVAALGIGERVHFVGAVDDDDLPALYSAAQAFVFPSVYEGFGLPPLEAMACGTPVLVEAGLQIAPHDVAAWADAMQRVLDDASLREQLSQHSLQQAKRFTWAHTAEQTYNAYMQQLEIW